MATRRSSVTSPPRKSYSVWAASGQSPPLTSALTSYGSAVPSMSTCSTRCFAGRGDQPSFDSELVQRFLERSSSAMEAAHHRPDRNVENVRYLLVREALDVGQENGYPELLGQVLNRRLDLGLREPVEYLLLGTPPGGGGLQTTQPAVQV